MKKIISFSIWSLFYSVLCAQINLQSSFTLEECITIAIDNNLDVKSSTLLNKSSEINYKQALNELLPSINMNYNLGINNGRSIDPFTNSYINQELTFSNLGANLNVPLFNGFRILNNIKQSKYNMQATKMELEEVKQNLILNVIIGYIQILNIRDLVELSNTRLKTTEKQLKRLEVNFKEGLGNPADFSDIKGQYASDELAVINAENNFQSAILDFITLLNIENTSKKGFENISGLIESEKYSFSANDVYNDALQNLATFKSKQLRINAADSGIKIARANYFPEISLFGQLNTNYSSLAQTFTETNTTISETGNFVTINNQDYPVLQNETQFIGNKINYGDQFNNNLNTVIGLSVRVPLFNGFSTKNNVKLQKIQVEESELELLNTKLLFKQSIEQAYNNMESAFNRYHVLRDQAAAYEESYRINEVRFNNGVSNIVDYIVSKNNMDTAQLNLNLAKYEYLLRVKVLDFYRKADQFSYVN